MEATVEGVEHAMGGDNRRHRREPVGLEGAEHGAGVERRVRRGGEGQADRRVLAENGPVSEEIERKFLVPAAPAELGAGSEVRQGYLAVDGPVEVRLRRTDGGDRVTIKAGSGLVRTEVELPVDAGQADALWPATEGRRIEKV